LGVTAAVATRAPATQAKPAPWMPETENLLMIKVDGDSVDFCLVDPQGRVAVIAVDSAMSGIPDCEVSKSGDDPSNDEEEFDADTSTAPLPLYGGGVFTLEKPSPGEWRLEALARRPCEDSCGVSVAAWSMKNVVQDGNCNLRSGQSAGA